MDHFIHKPHMIWAWVIFIGFVFMMLALDLGVFHRKSHVVGFKESLGWSAIWITIGLSFSVIVYFAYDRHWFDLGYSVDAVDKAKVGGNQISNGLRGGEITERGQYFRHRHGFQLFGSACPLSTPSFVLGHHRRTRDAGSHDRTRRGIGAEFPCDPVFLRSIPYFHRNQNVGHGGKGRASGKQSGGPMD